MQNNINILTQLSNFMSGKGIYICVMRRSITISSDNFSCYIVKNILITQKDDYAIHIKNAFGTDIDLNNLLICAMKVKNIHQKTALLKDVNRYKLLDSKISNRELADMLKVSIRSYTTLIKTARKMFGTISVWQNKEYTIVEDTEFYNGIPLIKTKQPDNSGEFTVASNTDVFIDDIKDTVFEIFIDGSVDDNIFMDGNGGNEVGQQCNPNQLPASSALDRQPPNNISNLDLQSPKLPNEHNNIKNNCLSDFQIVLVKEYPISNYIRPFYNLPCYSIKDKIIDTTHSFLQQLTSIDLNTVQTVHNVSKITTSLNSPTVTIKKTSRPSTIIKQNSVRNSVKVNKSNNEPIRPVNTFAPKVSFRGVQIQNGKRMEIIGISKRDIVDERKIPKITTITLKRNPKFKIHTYKK